MLKIKRNLFLFAGILSLLYYLVCVAYAGFSLSFVWIWLLLGGFCFIRAYMITRKLQGRIKWQAPKGLINVSGVPAKTLMPVGIHYVVREFFGFVKWKFL